MGFFHDLLSSIPVYTGLSPVSFFTLCALFVGLYYLISGFFAAPKHYSVPMEPLPPPVQIGEVSEQELAAYDGTDPKKPLLMAIKGQIYDVSQSRMFYGPGGPYALFAGKDASRALAKMSFEESDLTGDIEGLSPFEMDALQDWEWKFMSKYVKVGQILKPKDETREVPVADVAGVAEASENGEKVDANGDLSDKHMEEGSEANETVEKVDANGDEASPDVEIAKEE